MIRSLMSMVGLVVGCAGIGLFIAIGIYVWMLKDEVNSQTTILAARANMAGDGANEAINFVRKVISQAEVDLKTARAQAEKTQPARPVSLMDQIIAPRHPRNWPGRSNAPTARS